MIETGLAQCIVMDWDVLRFENSQYANGSKITLALVMESTVLEEALSDDLGCFLKNTNWLFEELKD